MKQTGRIAALLLLGALGAGCARGGAEPDGSPKGEPDDAIEVSGFDLSTDEGVQAAYRHVTGTDRYGYVRRLEGIPRIVIVNDRWPDVGDVFQGAFIDRRWYPDGQELRPALRALGWDGADAERRVEIARTWIERSQRYGQVIREPVGDPVGSAHQDPAEIGPPIYEATGDGGVRADIWVVTGWGVAGQPLYAHRELRFGPSGDRAE